MPGRLPIPQTRLWYQSRRYWTIDYAFPGDVNRIEEASEATGLPPVGLVDDDAGGVIGYISADFAPTVLDVLNPPEPVGPDLSPLEDLLVSLLDENVDPLVAERLVQTAQDELQDRNTIERS
jgi:hypothetical protein